MVLAHLDTGIRPKQPLGLRQNTTAVQLLTFSSPFAQPSQAAHGEKKKKEAGNTYAFYICMALNQPTAFQKSSTNGEVQTHQIHVTMYITLTPSTYYKYTSWILPELPTCRCMCSPVHDGLDSCREREREKRNWSL